MWFEIRDIKPFLVKFVSPSSRSTNCSQLQARHKPPSLSHLDLKPLDSQFLPTFHRHLLSQKLPNKHEAKNSRSFH